MKKSFNLSDWALEHKSLVWYFMIACMVIGLASYFKLGREEDPSFTIKTMVIQANWPGASAEEVTKQVTERIEKKLEELDSLDFTRSITTSGQTIIFLNLKQTTKARDVAPTWTRARNMIGDIKGDLPQGVVGPFFNDNFGDVYGNVYAFTSDGLTPRQLRDYVEDVRSKVLTVPNIGKVDIVGAQDEVIYLEFSTRKIAALGLDQQLITTTLQKQNAVTPSGTLQAGAERVSLRVSGQFTSEESLLDINFRVNDRFFRLSDVATIRRGYADPPSTLFRFNGQPAIGLAVGMKQGANLLEFGKALDDIVQRATKELPLGVSVFLVADQPKVVEHAVSGFTEALAEAVGIVLIVSFVSLGLRAGLVVALAIPLVLAITFLVMEYSGISLQRISLGALIIALGLLVDDAMIAVEMMVARLELGDSLRKAATYVYTSTAFPMLTGTLVTVAGFIPVGLNSSAAGEFTFTLFVVIAVSLTVSWVVAVLFTPLLGVAVLPKTMKQHDHHEKSRAAKWFGNLIVACLRFRWITIGVTLAAFALSLFGMGFVQQQFFPSSDRPELIVDWNLPHNATIAETSAQMKRFEDEMLKGNPDVDHWSSYVGRGAMRFVLSFDVQPNDPSFGQMVILTKDIAARDRQLKRLSTYARKTFVGSDVFVHTMDIGPPVGRPVQYRVSGPDVQKVRAIAQDLAAVVAKNRHIGSLVFDWMEPIRVVKVEVLQDKARQLNVTSADIAGLLNAVVGGQTVTQLRDDIYLVNIVSRAVNSERTTLETLQNLQLPGAQGQSVPLASVATFHYELEQPTIWRRSRLPTITVKAAIADSAQPATAVAELEPLVKELRAKLPAGYSIALGGAVEESTKSQQPIIDVTPLMLLVMMTILMIQLQSFSRLFLVFAVAPLAMIGVVVALLPSGAPMGFVAILGTLALIGILIRNSVILVVQIEDLKAEGKKAWDAVIEATEGRVRPIVLTAAAASLGLIPIAREVFWGPMAYAMMGGIIVGTALTLLFLPALYVAWFRIRETD